jgi:DNA-binding NtrC family response regulator
MSVPRQILIVSHTPALGNRLRAWLSDGSYWLTAATTFGAAKLQMQMEPALVITELKLGEYNGLHLAVRANHSHIPVVVIGERDRFFEQEAELFGATYLRLEELSRERILSRVESQIAQSDSHVYEYGGLINSTGLSPHTRFASTPVRRVRVN